MKQHKHKIFRLLLRQKATKGVGLITEKEKTFSCFFFILLEGMDKEAYAFTAGFLLWILKKST